MDKNDSGAPHLRYSDLVMEYIEVCNAALYHNSQRFPYKQILGAAKSSAVEQPIEVNVQDWGHSESYVFTLSASGITAKPHGECTDCNCVRKWGVSKDYLEQVAQKPAEYISNPAKLNWDWLNN